MDKRLREDQLLRLLRHRARCTVDGLAAELNVSRRTMLRDLQRLRDRGFDISSMTGPGGGVRLEPTSVMLTSQLDGSEVIALMLAAAFARATPGIPFLGGAESAIAKIEAALPLQRAAELQQFMHRVLIDSAPGDAGTVVRPVADNLVDTFETAFTANRILEFDYTDKSERATNRAVEPHGLLVRSPHWYVIAWDPLRDAPRLFRADRIADPRVGQTSFVPRPHELVNGVCPDAQSIRPSNLGPKDA